MHRLTTSLALTAACLLTGGYASVSYAASVGETIAPLHPPKIDYAKVCASGTVTAYPPAREWSHWDGSAAGFSAKELFLYGKLYLRGDAHTPRNPQLAARIFAAVADGSSAYAARAKHYLATMTQEGDGVASDNDSATALFKEALEGGVTASAYGLGSMYFRSGNYEQAAHYYQLAASRKHAPSALALAGLYANHSVPSPQPDSARIMFALAENLLLENIARGHCGLLYNVGAMYASGSVVAQNKDVAQEWFLAAAEAQNLKALQEVAEYYLTQDDGEAGHRKAIALWQQAAALGSAEAQRNLGYGYFYGNGIGKDVEAGLRWLERASLFGDAQASHFLLKYYFGAHGDTPHYETGFQWLEKISHQAHVLPSLLVKLGTLYEEGLGTPRDPEKAFALFKNAAAQGNREAYYRLGEAYLYGRGVAQQPTRSLRFFRLAAAMGFPDAYRMLENMYRCGMGIPPHPALVERWQERAIAANNETTLLRAAKEAYGKAASKGDKEGFSLLTKAAKQRDRRAMALLALAYRYGQGTHKDEEKADRWEARALEGDNNGVVFYTLAQAYLKGYLAPKNTKKAQAYFEQAAALSYLSAQYELGRRHLTGRDGFTLKEKEGVELLEKAAARGHRSAMFQLAEYYHASREESVREKGRGWLRKAAQNGHIPAMTRLAQAYYTGKDAPLDTAQAIVWIEAAQQAFPCTPQELTAVGRSLLQGIGTQSEDGKAGAYLTQAAEMGYADAQRELGMMYLAGLDGIPRDSAKGVDWIHKAAQQGDVRSMLELGNAYAAGDGVEQSLKSAAGWWKKAADSGNKEAKAKLNAIPGLSHP